MKFETKFGLGEIVYYTRSGHKTARHDQFTARHDELLEVVAIAFDKNGVSYYCRYPQGITTAFTEGELIGDPDFDQDKGQYDYDITGS